MDEPSPAYYTMHGIWTNGRMDVSILISLCGHFRTWWANSLSFRLALSYALNISMQRSSSQPRAWTPAIDMNECMNKWIRPIMAWMKTNLRQDMIKWTTQTNLDPSTQIIVSVRTFDYHFRLNESTFSHNKPQYHYRDLINNFSRIVLPIIKRYMSIVYHCILSAAVDNFAIIQKHNALRVGIIKYFCVETWVNILIWLWHGWWKPSSTRTIIFFGANNSEASK